MVAVVMRDKKFWEYAWKKAVYKNMRMKRRPKKLRLKQGSKFDRKCVILKSDPNGNQLWAKKYLFSLTYDLEFC